MRLFAILFVSLIFSPSSVHATADCVTLQKVPAGKRTVSDVVKELGPAVEARIKAYFVNAGVAYPPQSLAFVVFKEEMALELWAEKDDGSWVYLHTYDFLGSGGLGPKRRNGDLQVPEGIYRVVELNPASRFHLSMKLNYPNDFDQKKARVEKRSNLGGDIYIHGNIKSRGCLAVGDRAIEELFLVAAKTGTNNIKVIIAPKDIRDSTIMPQIPLAPQWLPELYENIGQELSKFKQRRGA